MTEKMYKFLHSMLITFLSFLAIAIVITVSHIIYVVASLGYSKLLQQVGEQSASCVLFVVFSLIGLVVSLTVNHYGNTSDN